MVNGLDIKPIGKKVKVQYREIFDRDTGEEDFFLGTFDSGRYNKVTREARDDLNRGVRKIYHIEGDYNDLLMTAADNGTINFSMISKNSLILRTGVHIEDLCIA